MAKPVILAVDDDPQVLRAVGQDLKARYLDYRVVLASSGAEALETLQQLLERGHAIALFVADERMPGMLGTEFLTRAIRLAPEAGRVLLTAYADTETAIRAINAIGLDHYLLKPWHPPEEKFYPVLDDLLAEWTASSTRLPDGIRIGGTALSPASYAMRSFMAANGVAYHWIDLDRDAATRELALRSSPDLNEPLIWFTDGSVLVNPEIAQLAAKLDMSTRPALAHYDLVIVGGGPAGLAAAVYGASEGLRTALVERLATGGQAGTSSNIENYLGFPEGVAGADLAERASRQARKFETEILKPQEVTAVETNDPYRTLVLSDGTRLSATAVLLAPGMEVRRLEAPGVEALSGAGIFYGAGQSEGALLRRRHVHILGAANSAGQAALHFSRYAYQVTMLVRGSGLDSTMSDYLVKRIAAARNIDVIAGVSVAGVSGHGHLESITLLHSETGNTTEVAANALFIFIGQAPRTAFVDGVVGRDGQGFILTGPDLPRVDGRVAGWPARLRRDPFLLETSVPGVFAAGDARHGSGKRVAAAVGEGSATVGMVHQYLSTV
ncbi:MAG: FAD-dependent oxidoreductase [Gemmatimonadota bacterium]